MQWADEFRSFGVRANADIPRDAEVARRFGAGESGCAAPSTYFSPRTHSAHASHDSDAHDEKSRRKALTKLLPMQRIEASGLFKEMDGFPVVIRTLDPPLHEFLPKRENLMVDLARLPHANAKAKKEMSERYGIPVGQLKKALPPLLARVEDCTIQSLAPWSCGCRLGITYPEITEMQARAAVRAPCRWLRRASK